MATALAAILARRGWAGNGVRLIRSLRDHIDRRPPALAEDPEAFRALPVLDRETALLDAILRGYIRL